MHFRERLQLPTFLPIISHAGSIKEITVFTESHKRLIIARTDNFFQPLCCQCRLSVNQWGIDPFHLHVVFCDDQYFAVPKFAEIYTFFPTDTCREQ